MAQLATVQAQLEQAQAQLSDTVQLGLARAVAAAETMRDDSDRISSALAELEGWSRRLERLEVDLSAAERRLDGAAEELRRQAASLEGAQRTSMLSATQQVPRLAAPPSHPA
jgi:chromosome segregation ATPase